MPEPRKTESQLAKDIKFVVRHAAVIGFLLAVLCHVLPTAWKAPCNTLRALCAGSTN